MKRHELREHIFLLLFRVEFNDPQEMPEQVALFVDEMRGDGKASAQDENYIQSKYEKVLEKLPQIDELLEGASKGWKLSRMNRVDLTILRLAVYEMKFDDDIPEKVAINEAVELAKKFSGDDAPSFVNGVLAKLADDEES